MSSSPFTGSSLEDKGLQRGEPAAPGWNSVFDPGPPPPPPASFTVDELLSALQAFACQIGPMQSQTEELEKAGDITARWQRAQLGVFVSRHREFFQQIPGIPELRTLCGAFWGDELTLETARRIKGMLHSRLGLSAEQAGSLQIADAAERLRTTELARNASVVPPLIPTSPDNRNEATSVTTLLRQATEAYAASKSSIRLAAFPAGLRVSRCEKEDDPNCLEIVDGAVVLPWGCVQPAGTVNLSRTEESHQITVYSLMYRAPDELNQFLDFCPKAGAVLVACPPQWANIARLGNAKMIWLAALFFGYPHSEQYVAERPGGVRLISEPWAASIAVLRDWSSGSDNPRGPSGTQQTTDPQRRETVRSPASETKPKANDQEEPEGTELTKAEKAMQIYLRDPNQSLREVAGKVPCDPALLSRDPRFKRLRQAHQGKLPKGSKSKDGKLEADADD